jgi:hypothetical protein
MISMIRLKKTLTLHEFYSRSIREDKGSVIVDSLSFGSEGPGRGSVLRFAW